MTGKIFHRCFFTVALVATLLLGLGLLPHRETPFVPDYPKQALTPLLKKEVLSDGDYQTIFLQTGLARAGVDAFLHSGGVQSILAAQDAFFAPVSHRCIPLGPITWEDRQEGGFPMVPTQTGDVLLSFSTHTLGWRHGHAGIVADAAGELTLEAVVLGSDSALMPLEHWGRYSTFLHLRVRGITGEEQRNLGALALERLNGIPYRLTAGLRGEKFIPPETEGISGAQCAYLVWYALMAAGYDTDGDGGALVTVRDLAASPLFDVVQVYGIDPTHFLSCAPAKIHRKQSCDKKYTSSPLRMKAAAKEIL